ncbi:MAG: hypothetical protein C4334_08125 [Pyrinomonas sp.]
MTFVAYFSTPSFRQQTNAAAPYVKAKIAEIGVRSDKRMEVVLKDSSKLKGYIAKIADDYFVIADPRSGTIKRVAYSQVQQIKTPKLSPRVKRALIYSILFGVGGAIIADICSTN